MDKSSKSVVSLVLGVLVLAGGYFGAYGQWQALTETRAAFNVSKTENDRLKKAQADINSFVSQYESNKEASQLAERALPTGDPRTPLLLGNLSQLATESGMAISRINIVEAAANAEAAPAPSSIGTVDIDVDMKGTYESFQDFMLRLQRNLRIIDAINVNVSGDEEASDGGRSLKLSLKFRTYYQR